VPRIFEKVYAAAMAMIPPDGADEVAAAIDLGNRVRDARYAGEEVSAEDAAEFERVDAELFPLVRSIFGGNLSLAISGAAPIAPEILRFFFACGVPVMEGWGLTETVGIGTVNRPAAHRFGTIGRAIGGADIRIADDGEIEIAGDFLMREYWNIPQATKEAFSSDGYLRTGDLGSIDADGYVTITGRKKDIIITAGGKNLTPANLEGELRRSRWLSQVVMFGDRKPYPVAVLTLDAEVVVPWAEGKGYPTDLASLAHNDELLAMIQDELDAANARYAGAEQIKRFRVLDRDFTVDSGELTPSMKLKRNVVYVNLADEFERLYE
jgi:long-chain acyl-CoA synthetase